MTTGDRLRLARDRYGLTVATVVRWIGCTRRAWERWEDGTRTMEPYVLRLILVELARRHAVRAKLGTAPCPDCGSLAIEDDGQGDRYGCVSCDARVEP